MIIPILTLDYLRRGAAGSFQYAEELEYRKPNTPKPFIECDVSCIVDGVITIGEAKTADRLDVTRKKELQIIQEYLQLASMIGARRLVSVPELTNGTLRLFRASRLPWQRPRSSFCLSKNQLFV